MTHEHFLDGLWVDGEVRISIQCNLCGAIAEACFIAPEPLREPLQQLIEANPDEALAAVRDAAAFASHWGIFQLPDGGVMDICPECIERGPGPLLP
jgi:hypothetical protein